MRYGITIQSSKVIQALSEDSDNRPFYHRDFIVFNGLCIGFVVGWSMLFCSLVLL